MRELDVVVERDGKWWVFEIPELGTGGQALSLAEVDDEARDVAAMWLEEDLASIKVDVTINAAAHSIAEWEAAEREEIQAREAQAHAAERRRAVVRELRGQKFSALDVARILGISKQRVYQLEKK
ncbi:hypothetical protein [Gulosibacter molinativorax]|uniref:Antitoxin HicB n=1 Tax=Gulosibacter molinativorax TaxID=256821 RepID=A0ABT7CAV3_9MICO|nr:hypothetical protein [Gulosibacter molinativorax]MDJ1372274.1 antitoxin HicB [Gulosibacter molinativorax]QUY63441.1 Toxin-antitoxin system, antitoxin component, HicB family [Gulosibacter molinativorax]